MQKQQENPQKLEDMQGVLRLVANISCCQISLKHNTKVID